MHFLQLEFVTILVGTGLSLRLLPLDKVKDMKLGFRSLAILCASVCFALAFVWMMLPGMLLETWGVGFTDAAGLVGRHSAALFFGIGIMFFRARKLAPSRARQTIVTGFVSACLALAALGIFELAAGHAGHPGGRSG